MNMYYACDEEDNLFASEHFCILWHGTTPFSMHIDWLLIR